MNQICALEKLQIYYISGPLELFKPKLKLHISVVYGIIETIKLKIIKLGYSCYRTINRNIITPIMTF